MPKEKIKKEDIPKLIEQMMKEAPEQGIDKELLKLALTPKEGEDPFLWQ